jgi:hypothetical protein
VQGPRATCSNSTAQRATGIRQSDPHLLSSDTSTARTKRGTSGSTGVRRKSSATIKLVADTTLEGSEKLLAGLKEINDTTKELKTQEMQQEVRIHAEEMQYRREKDDKVLENTRLSLLN